MTATYKKKFKGIVKRIVKQTATIEFERLVFNTKYERFAKKRTRIHARIPKEFIGKIKINDNVEATKCRPLSKLVHHVITKIR